MGGCRMTRAKTSASVKALRDAERAVEKARVAHRAAFRKALAALFNEYGLRLGAAGSCAKLIIGPTEGEFTVEELPE